MTKYVRDTAAGKSISAYVILRDGIEVATVNVHYGNSRVLVNIFQSDQAAKACAAALNEKSHVAPSKYVFQKGAAGGYGYDKYTAAISGCIIDGHKITNHCDERLALPRGRQAFGPRFKAPAGYHVANWSQRLNGWTDCYREPGLKYLEAIGYTVIQAI
jgi:hypothetical protein